MGKIQILEELLGQPESPDAELECLTAEELKTRFERLRAKYHAERSER